MDSASRMADKKQGEFRMGNECELSNESGSLLSGGLSVAGAMSSGYELVVDRAAAHHGLSGVSEGLLLS